MTNPTTLTVEGMARSQALMPSAIKFAIRYSDDSGDELAVAYDRRGHRAGKIVISAVDTVEVDPLNLDWLITALSAIRAALEGERRNERDGRSPASSPRKMRNE